MLLNKTGKARDALGAGSSAGLSLQERRILILTDGKRSLNEVMAMLGADILPAMDRLMREGYIAGAAPKQAADIMTARRVAPSATRTPRRGSSDDVAVGCDHHPLHNVPKLAHVVLSPIVRRAEE